MLKLKDMVFRNIGTKDKPEVRSANYERVYFTHTTGDKVKNQTKQFLGKDSGFCDVPDGKSSTDLDTLYNQMIDYFKAEFPDKPVNQTIMELCENAVDMTKRTNIGTSLVPRELDLNKTFEKNAKSMVDLYTVTKGAIGEQFIDYQSALAYLKEQVGGAASAA